MEKFHLSSYNDTTMNLWHSKLLQQIPWLFHTTSTKDFGSLRYPNFGEIGDQWKPARENFYQELGIDTKKVFMSGNIHGNQVKLISSKDNYGRVEGYDGLLTTEPGLTLAVKTADCLPLFFVDPKNKIIGLIHSGWKGTAGNIAGAAVEEFKKLGSNSTDLLVAIGPSIKKCHYDISPERLIEMSGLKKYITEKNGKFFVDLQTAVVDELLVAGVSQDNIDADPPCTMCKPEKYFSYHSSGKFEDSLLSVIVMR